MGSTVHGALSIPVKFVKKVKNFVEKRASRKGTKSTKDLETTFCFNLHTGVCNKRIPK